MDFPECPTKVLQEEDGLAGSGPNKAPAIVLDKAGRSVRPQLLVNEARESPRRGMAQHGIARHGMSRHSAAQRSTAQRSTAQHSTAQRSTAQHSTAQCSDKDRKA